MNADPHSPGKPEPQPSGDAPVRRHWGSFELLGLVGRGGFGEVYRAWDPHLQREVALKLLLPCADDDTQFEDMLREARALASVRHANIVPIYGVDRQDGIVGFWTDFVQGKTLAALLREQGPLGYREAAWIGIDVCRALSAVHLTGLLHRDIKAENVMREQGGRILLMDFGLSVMPEGQHAVAGTPRYMAPELFDGAPATVGSDLYAVGVLLFFLVTGQFPAHGSDALTQAAQGNDEPTAATIAGPFLGRPTSSPRTRSVLDYRSDLPEALARVIDTAVQPEAAKRFQSAGAFSVALSEALDRQSSSQTAIALPAAPKASRLWIYLLVALALGVVPVVAILSSSHGRRADMGKTAAANEKYLQAQALLKRYDKRKNVTDATQMLQEVLAQDPNFALAQAGLGQAYFLQYRTSRTPGLLVQAKKACNDAIEQDPGLAPPVVTLARINAMAGNTALAMQQVQQALQLEPRSAEAYGAQSEVFDAEGRGADAIAAAERAGDLEPDYWRWPVLLGHYYFVAGKLPEAVDQFQRAVSIAPDNAIALLDLGLADLQLGRLDEARTSLEKSAQIQSDFPAYSALAEAATAKGDFAGAVTISKKAVDLRPNNYVAWGNLGSAYQWSAGGHEQAMAAYKKAIELAEASRKDTPGDPQLLADLGGYYADAGEPQRSRALLRQAVALAPENPSVLFIAGDGYEILHERAEAIRLIAKSLALGFHGDQFERSPELAALRADSAFQAALAAERRKIALDKQGKAK